MAVFLCVRAEGESAKLTGEMRMLRKGCHEVRSADFAGFEETLCASRKCASRSESLHDWIVSWYDSSNVCTYADAGLP